MVDKEYQERFNKAMDEALAEGLKKRKEKLDRLSYAILESSDKIKLETQVIKYMRDGWKVSGGVCFSGIGLGFYIQAMVRE